MKYSPRVKKFSLKVRMAKLRQRQSELKARIVEELKRPAPCSTTLQQLKRRKLRIKDDLARHEGILRTLDALAPRAQSAGSG
ncbi:DUF465 domain-containing protein [Ruegeria sediminis]|uniref:DUF465 domain-containing protein n=1 Tax=Ruegeria sediminis TaxID=2583820 RepID=A0ABY2WUY2_9RHOB|nr:YdcH family protein [Ruegeria sediminis]TMV06416.1 DUF465 domain-containing protein [Ruegeria sediminis]